MQTVLVTVEKSYLMVRSGIIIDKNSGVQYISIFYIHKGVNPYKAGKFRAEESSGEKQSQQVDSRYDIFEGENGDGRTTDKYVRDLTYLHLFPIATSSVKARSHGAMCDCDL